MSDKVEVIILDVPIDLTGKEDIVQTFAVNKLNEVKSRQGNYSNTFKAPTTARNKATFENAQQLHSTTLKPYRKLPTEIRVGGVSTAIGNVQIMSTKDDFELVFKSGNAELFEAIAGKSIRDLDLSAYDHIWNATNVYASRANNYTGGYIYPDIDYGLFEVETTNVQPFQRFFPATYCYLIFTEIMIQAGFTVSGAFLNNALFRTEILPFSGKVLRHSERYKTFRSFRARMIPITYNNVGFNIRFTGYDNDSTNGYFDNSNQMAIGAWGTPRLYTNAEQFDMSFYVKVEFEISGWVNGSSSFSITIAGGGSGVDYQHTNAQGNGIFSTIITTTRIGMAAAGVTDVQFIATNVTFEVISGEFYNTPLDLVYQGTTVNLEGSLQDISQGDFLLTIANQFGLIFQTNNLTSNVNIFQFDDVIENQNRATDWRGKVDLMEKPEIRYVFEDYAKNNLFKYLTDENDKLLLLDPEYGNSAIAIDNDFLPNEKTVFESVFAPVKQLVSFTGTIVIAFIPKYESGSSTIDAVPRIAYVDIANTTGLLQISGQPTRTTSPAVYFTELEFSSLIVNNYEVFSRVMLKAKLVRALVRLTTADINGLDFSLPCLFAVNGEDGLFYKNEITQFKYNKRESTECELILLRP